MRTVIIRTRDSKAALKTVQGKRAGTGADKTQETRGPKAKFNHILQKKKNKKKNKKNEKMLKNIMLFNQQF